MGSVLSFSFLDRGLVFIFFWLYKFSGFEG